MERTRILKRPIVTEKSTILGETGPYDVEVGNRANKNKMGRAVELACDVKVVKVNTLMGPGKVKHYGRRPSKRPDWKKAIVSLAAGDSIQLFEGA